MKGKKDSNQGKDSLLRIGETLMNRVSLLMSDEALADLHAVQFKLRAAWKDSPRLADYEPTESDAVRTALAMFVDGDRSVADLVPSGRA